MQVTIEQFKNSYFIIFNPEKVFFFVLDFNVSANSYREDFTVWVY